MCWCLVFHLRGIMQGPGLVFSQHIPWLGGCASLCSRQRAVSNTSD